ncbi:MAG: hypothetical protein V4635_06465 [Bacteroidota bacterium]
MKTLFKYIGLLIFVLIFCSCKKVKYPENNKKTWGPQKIDLMRGSITVYKVNGIDSLDALDSYWLSHYKRSLKLCRFNIISEDRRNVLYESNFGLIKYAWTNKYKNIYIYHLSDPKRNIFIETGISWQILKLEQKSDVNHHLKIRSEQNGNTYEIQFN